MRERAYLPHIDGLRAIAVSAVILYHLGFHGLPGGYIGVDIFFVISGFIITSIVNEQLSNNSFSFSKFYERRIRRIIPTLYMLIIVTYIIALSILLPTDVKIFSRSAISSVSFLSNVYLWRTISYFDISSEYNLFLHTWSLAVEEQFYILFPFALMIVNARLPESKLIFTLSIACLSFILCVLTVQNRPTAAFYLPVFRAWELLAGSAVALAPSIAVSPRGAMAASVAGLLLLFFPIAFYDRHTVFPSWSALPPVLGAALLIVFANGNKIGALLSLRPIVAIGLISYSLYLWHWPLLVFLKHYKRLDLTEGDKWILLIATVGLASLSYHFIEKPFRFRQDVFPRGWIFKAWAVSTAAIIVASALVSYENGYPARFRPEVTFLDQERSPDIPFMPCLDASYLTARYRTHDFCNLGTGERRRLLLLGDSHLLAWAPALDAALRRHRQSATFVAAFACPPVFLGEGSLDALCYEQHEAALRYLAAHSEIDTVLLAASWSMYTRSGGRAAPALAALFDDAFRRTVATLHDMGKRAIILGPTPGAPSGGPFGMALAKAHAADFPEPFATSAYIAANASIFALSREAARQGSADFIDVSEWFCRDGRCAYEQDGRPWYRDDGHLNVRGAMSKVDQLDAALGAVDFW